jgi:hypothetical protein
MLVSSIQPQNPSKAEYTEKKYGISNIQIFSEDELWYKVISCIKIKLIHICYWKISREGIGYWD